MMKRMSCDEIVKAGKTEKDVKILFVEKSQNKKTGNISQTYASEISCPLRCPYRCLGCLGENFTTRQHWYKADEKQGIDPDRLEQYLIDHACTNIVRISIAGDLAKPGTNDINEHLLNSYIKAFTGKKVFGYTHCEINERNINLLKNAEKLGVVVAFSCETTEQCEKALKAGCSAVLSVESMEGKVKEVNNIKYIKCPNTDNPDIKCANCRICTNPNRKFVIVFPLHGNGKGKAKQAGFLLKWQIK